MAPLIQVVGDALRNSGLVDFPTDQMNLILHGKVVDNTRLKDVFGYEPKFSTLEAFNDFIGARSRTVRGPKGLVDWEANLYSFVEDRLKQVEAR
jgi:hypothetical protein